MYSYTEFDDHFLAARNAQFRSQVERRIDGSLTEDEFKPLRLMNGLYLQLHAYMRHRGQMGSGLWPFHHAPEHPV